MRLLHPDGKESHVSPSEVGNVWQLSQVRGKRVRNYRLSFIYARVLKSLAVFIPQVGLCSKPGRKEQKKKRNTKYRRHSIVIPLSFRP